MSAIKDYLRLAEASTTPVYTLGFGIKGLLKMDRLDNEVVDNVHGFWAGMDGVMSHNKMYRYDSPERSKVLQLCGWGSEDDKYGALKDLVEE